MRRGGRPPGCARSAPPPAPAAPEAQDIPLAVAYEDKDLIVIEKPAGLVVHPAAGNPDGTLYNQMGRSGLDVTLSALLTATFSAFPHLSRRGIAFRVWFER